MQTPVSPPHTHTRAHHKLLLRVKVSLESEGCSAGIPTEELVQKGRELSNLPEHLSANAEKMFLILFLFILSVVSDSCSLLFAVLLID